MALTEFTIIRRSLAARPFVTATTIATVAVAVGLLLVLLGMKDAGFRAFERGSGNMHLIVSRDSSPLVSVLNGVFYASPPRRPIEWSEYEALADRFPWEYAIPTQLGDSYLGSPVLATTPEFFTGFSPDPRPGTTWPLGEGRFFEAPFEVVLGAAAAKATGLSVGDRIQLAHGMGKGRIAPPPADDEGDPDDHQHDHVHDEFDFEVVGILDRTGGPHDRAVFTDLRSSWIVHAHDRRQREDHAAHTDIDDLIDEDRKITGVLLRVATREGSMMSGGMQQAFDMLRRDSSITVARPANQIQQLFAIVSNIDQIFIGMSVVVMVSSGIAIMLALYSSMEQRRRQTAVLRVLGFSRRRIFALVLTESAVIGMLGAAVGIVLGMGGVQIVAVVMKQRLGLVIEPRLFSEWTLPIIIFTVAMAALAGVVPAAKAYRNPVAKNLAPLG